MTTSQNAGRHCGTKHVKAVKLFMLYMLSTGVCRQVEMQRGTKSSFGPIWYHLGVSFKHREQVQVFSDQNSI